MRRIELASLWEPCPPQMLYKTLRPPFSCFEFCLVRRLHRDSDSVLDGRPLTWIPRTPHVVGCPWWLVGRTRKGASDSAERIYVVPTPVLVLRIGIKNSPFFTVAKPSRPCLLYQLSKSLITYRFLMTFLKRLVSA